MWRIAPFDRGYCLAEDLADASGLQLADSQKAAIRLTLMAKVLVITGGPGVGKTTIVNSILRISRGQRRAMSTPARDVAVGAG